MAGLMSLLLAWPTVSALAQESTLRENAQWRDAVQTDLAVNFGQTGFHARWQYQRCACGDLLVKVEQASPDGVLRGELLMVAGQLLLAHGLTQQETDIAPLMQAPALMLQLVYALLDRSQPQGPSVVTGKQQWRVKEKNINFRLNTGQSTGIFAAPWRIQGNGWVAASGHRRFELSFQFANPTPDSPGATGTITFSGNLDFDKEVFPLAESSGFEGWRMQWLSSNGAKSRPVPKGLTLKDLRLQVQQRQAHSANTPAKD